MLPVMQTRKLTLRPLHEDDFEALYRIQSDDQAMKYTYTATSLEEFSDHIRAYAKLESTIGYAPWAAVHTDSGILCGWGGLGVDPFYPGWGVEISYFFDPHFWGRGLATELVRASLEFGFQDIGLPRIGAFAHPDNQASTRVLEKCGFRLLGYEPKLARNQYEIRSEWWQRLPS
ncbi:MAG: GNAT family N-acetyltransferase [Caldilineaceae bacterium]|nr:GNAT family N-acetyltransferase [Caldilineaceae bacterium]